MAVRGVAGGSMEGGAENNADLNALGSAINDGFKDLEANPESGGEISVPGGEEEEAPPPADTEDEPEETTTEDDEEQEAAPAKDPAAPPAAPPVEPGKSAPGEPPSAPTTPAKPMDLTGLAKDHLDAVRKFVPGNSLDGITEDGFKDAEKKMVADYWRIQNENKRLAEERKAKDEATPRDPDAPPADKTPAPPKEVEHIVARKQEIVTSDGPKAMAQIEGWKAHAAKLRTDLAAKESTGEMEAEDVVRAHRAIAAADKNAEIWQKTYNKHAREYRDLHNREQEVLLSLNLRERLDRQEQKTADDTREKLSNQFLTDWNKTYDEILGADEYKALALDKEDLAALQAHAMAQTHFEAGRREGGIPEKDVKGFLSKVIKDFTEPVRKAAERAKKSLATDKAADAPKIPPQAGAPRKPKAKTGSRTAEPSLRTLEQRVMKHEGWDKV